MNDIILVELIDEEHKWSGSTSELAHINRPPIGAKMIPMIKKKGNTLLGVKIGLHKSQRTSLLTVLSWMTYCQAFRRCWRNAVSATGI